MDWLVYGLVGESWDRSATGTKGMIQLLSSETSKNIVLFPVQYALPVAEHAEEQT
jgi:hypothetical protein